MKRLLLLACTLLAATVAGAQAPIGGVGGVGLTGRAGAQALASPYILCKSAVAVVTPADATEDTLYTCTVPANAMGANGQIRLTTAWSYTNSANNKTLRVRWSGIGGTALGTVVKTTTVISFIDVMIQNRGATNLQAIKPVYMDNAASPVSGGFSATAIDTTAATTLVITGQKAVSTDTLTLESVLVELLSDGT